MITLKYEKKNPAIYISHIDLLRAMVKIIRRTNFIPDFSKGFNPHMLLFFSPPIAVGVSSECEYVTIDIKGVDASELKDAFNRCAPDGFYASETFVTEKSPNLAGTIQVADYVFPVKNTDCTAKIAQFFEKSTSYSIEFMQKGALVTKDVAAQIKGVKVTDNGLIFRLATGNDNLRADRLLLGLKKDFGIDTEIVDICKKTQFVMEKGIYIPVDEILNRG